MLDGVRFYLEGFERQLSPVVSLYPCNPLPLILCQSFQMVHRFILVSFFNDLKLAYAAAGLWSKTTPPLCVHIKKNKVWKAPRKSTYMICASQMSDIFLCWPPFPHIWYRWIDRAKRNSTFSLMLKFTSNDEKNPGQACIGGTAKPGLSNQT